MNSSNGHRLWELLVAMIVVLLVAGAVWYFFFTKNTSTPRPLSQTQTQSLMAPTNATSTQLTKTQMNSLIASGHATSTLKLTPVQINSLTAPK